MSGKTRPSVPVDPTYIPSVLSLDSVVSVSENQRRIEADILVIGSGMGGSALAYALKDSGREVLVVERGGFLPPEPENGRPEEMFVNGRYKNAGFWYDGLTGKEFAPGVYYWVGGNTKFYGATMPRFHLSDFDGAQHQDGHSVRWPFTYDDLEPFYCQAERLLKVRGKADDDPTEPPHSEPYAYPALEHEPTIEAFAESLRKQGLHPSHLPLALDVNTAADRELIATADGCPDESGLKSDSENSLLHPALHSGKVRILTHTEVLSLNTTSDGRRVTAANARRGGKPLTITANTVVVSGGAVNSAALLLRSGSQRHPAGLGNSSDQLGRNYMVHNTTFMIGVNPIKRNTTRWQKTLAVNDFYGPSSVSEFALGNLQTLGKLHAPMVKAARPWAPNWALSMMTNRSIDLYLTTEDLPSSHNRVRVDGERTLIDWTPLNVEPHYELVRRITKAVRKAGYPLVFTERMGIETNSHMCGTVRAGHDPTVNVLDANCKSHDVDNLWVVDSAFFPSSAALNPSLTIAANALRVAPHVANAN